MLYYILCNLGEAKGGRGFKANNVLSLTVTAYVVITENLRTFARSTPPRGLRHTQP